MSSSVIIDSLAVSFDSLWTDDPIMKALFDGNMLWGDILCTPEENERCRISRQLRQDKEDAARVEQDAENAFYAHREATRDITKPRVHFPNDGTIKTYNIKPLKPLAAIDRVVPSFTPGIHTLMAKNLPRDPRKKRDIEIKELVQELHSIFDKYGPIKDIYIPLNADKSSPYFGTIKGFATIFFLKSADSASAYTAEWSLISIRDKNIALEFAKKDHWKTL